MAALMKKRVLAEFNQSQVVNEPPLKRLRTLRLISNSGSKNGTEGSSALAYIECLEKCKCGNDALQLLVRISDTIAYISSEDVPSVVKKLSERFTIETEAAVRAKILWIFAELGEVTNDSLEKQELLMKQLNF